MALQIAEAALAAIDAMRPKRKPSRSGASHRTGAPVLRNSIEAGSFEEVFFVPPAKGETDKLLRVARKTLDAGKRVRAAARAEGRQLAPAEQLIASLTSAAVRVFEEMLTLSRLNAGRVFPTYDRLAEATGLGRATIARAIRILEAIGFIAKQRRFKRAERSGPGPRYEQTSNAYRPLLPQRVVAFLPRWMRPAPLPADAEQREADRVADTAHMLAGLSCKEFAQATVSGPMAKALATLGAAIDARALDAARESQIDPQPLLDSYIHSSNGVGLVGQRACA